MFDVNEAGVCAFDDCMCMGVSFCVFFCVHEDQECVCVCELMRAVCVRVRGFKAKGSLNDMVEMERVTLD